MKHLHHLVETQLEAPALAWNMLTWYWGMSAFGLGPAYKDYMQSDTASSDAAFNAESNKELNQISGLSRRLTIKERFDRAVNFYAYCYEQGMKTSINPPFDEPPTVNDLMLSRLRSEAKTPPPDKLIQASTASLLGGNASILQDLWDFGGHELREQRAQAYNARVLETLQYVVAEMESSCTPDQLSQTGFLVDGLHGTQFNVTADLMDETMSEEVQDNKFGDCYIQPSSTGPSSIVLSGIFGAYYTTGHNLELAMFNEEEKTRLSSIHHAILHTWRQLYDLSQETTT
jgi:hypothetical protein